MKELFAELRLKDYLIFFLTLIAVLLMINLSNILRKVIPKPNPEEYSIKVNAKILEKKPKQRRHDSQIGSSLKQIGYNVFLEYKIENKNYQTRTDFLYAHYDKWKTDSLLTLNDWDSLEILVKPQNFHSVILNMNSER